MDIEEKNVEEGPASSFDNPANNQISTHDAWGNKSRQPAAQYVRVCWCPTDVDCGYSAILASPGRASDGSRCRCIVAGNVFRVAAFFLVRGLGSLGPRNSLLLSFLSRKSGLLPIAHHVAGGGLREEGVQGLASRQNIYCTLEFLMEDKDEMGPTNGLQTHFGDPLETRL
jgi:hypothetical protein